MFKLIGAYSRSELFANGNVCSNLEIYADYRDYLMNIFGIPENAAHFLVYQYGTMCLRVAYLGEERKLNEQVHPDFPFLKSQIAFSIEHEFVQKPTDVLCRRLPIAFLDK